MGGVLYISGQLPIDPATGSIAPGGIEEQTRQALANVESVLTRVGAAKEDVGMCRVYVSSIEHWDRVDAVYAEFFGDHRPARVVVPTRELHHGALVEIEAMAELR